MTDHIRLSRIGVFAYHGVLAAEQQLGQRFYISLDCMLDLRLAGTSDELEKSIDYSALAMRAQEVAVAHSFRTIEALAEAIAAACLADFDRLDAITVTVEKPAAPVTAMLENIAVEITRSRGHG